MSSIEIFENERALNYNKFVETWIPDYYSFLNHLPKLLKETKEKNLLVVGCGTGNEIDRFIELNNHWTITGVDPSPDMIKQARNKFLENDNVSLITGLVSDLKKDKAFNAATLLLVLHFLDDNGNKLNLLKDIANKLISGGELVILDITGNKDQIQNNLKILKLLLPDHLDEEIINYRLNRIENELYAVSEERLSELLQEAGFEKPIRFFQSSIYMGWLTKKT